MPRSLFAGVSYRKLTLRWLFVLNDCCSLERSITMVIGTARM